MYFQQNDQGNEICTIKAQIEHLQRDLNSLFDIQSAERLIKTLTKLCKQSYTSQEILNKIFKKLDDFTGQNRHLEDDASMVIFQLK